MAEAIKGLTTLSTCRLYFTVTMTPASRAKLNGEEQETTLGLQYQCLRKCVLALARNSFFAQTFCYIVKTGIQVEHADGINKLDCKLTSLSETRSPTAVVAEYADIFRLLIHYSNSIDQNENL